MKKITQIIIIIILILLPILSYSNDIWQGIEIGMNLEQTNVIINLLFDIDLELYEEQELYIVYCIVVDIGIYEDVQVVFYYYEGYLYKLGFIYITDYSHAMTIYDNLQLIFNNKYDMHYEEFFIMDRCYNHSDWYESSTQLYVMLVNDNRIFSMWENLYDNVRLALGVQYISPFRCAIIWQYNNNEMENYISDLAFQQMQNEF